MNKAELIVELAEKAGLKKQNEEISIVGFGTLLPRPQNSRLARNPKTGTPVQIPARTTVKFKPGKFLLEAMNGSK